MDNKDTMQGQIPTQPVSLDEQNKFDIRDLERKVKMLEDSVRMLESLARIYIKENGIRVERFQDGLVIISRI